MIDSGALFYQSLWKTRVRRAEEIKAVSIMAVSIKIGMQQSQRLVLTQTLRQSIEMLQLSTLELAETIAQELVENPVLEEEDTARLPGIENGDGELISSLNRELSGDDSLQNSKDDIDLNFPDVNENGYSGPRDEEDRKRQFIENAMAHSESLTERLMSQARINGSSPAEVELMESIITAIDERGFFTGSIEEIAAAKGTDTDNVRKAIAVIGTFDPVGCGASSIQETLMIQASQLYPGDEILKAILKDFFRELEKLDYEKIARALNISLAEVIEKSRMLHTLTPFPGRQYSINDIRYIIPDVEVRYLDGEIIININDDWIPQIKINRYYLDMLKKKKLDRQLKEYIKEKVQSARYLLKNISSRRETIVKVVTAIMGRQEDFLLKGPGYLRPLTHTEIAGEVGLHESTVSRVTSNKFVQTGWGVFELKYFFVSKLKSDNDEEHSSDRVMNLIKEIIARENPEKPCSDEEILEKLRKMNINLARRTVAKYRGILKIPSSNRRKKLNMIRSEGEK